jgi:hypothetical protein
VIVTGNGFDHMAKGVELDTNSALVSVQSNVYIDTGSTNAVNDSSGNTVGGGSM